MGATTVGLNQACLLKRSVVDESRLYCSPRFRTRFFFTFQSSCAKNDQYERCVWSGKTVCTWVLEFGKPSRNVANPIPLVGGVARGLIDVKVPSKSNCGVGTLFCKSLSCRTRY